MKVHAKDFKIKDDLVVSRLFRAYMDEKGFAVLKALSEDKTEKLKETWLWLYLKTVHLSYWEHLDEYILTYLTPDNIHYEYQLLMDIDGFVIGFAPVHLSSNLTPTMSPFLL